MKSVLNSRLGQRSRHRLLTGVCASAVVAFGCVLGASVAQAIDFDTGSTDYKIRWDNTFKYSSSFRVRDPAKSLTNDVNLDDGDRNFKQGFVSNRFDLLSEFDASYKRFGVSASVAAWYDAAYDQTTDNTSASSTNSMSRTNRDFTAQTQKWMGKNAEILNGFAYGSANIGDTSLSGRVGRHSLVWGETLFFGGNGIAGAQQPVDLIKLLTVPSSQFKEIIRPVNQVSGQLQITPQIAVGAYYQLEWRPTLIPPAGSFLSATDFVGIGSERLFVGPPGAGFWRTGDISGKDSGQGGVQLKFGVPKYDLDFGLYYVRYNDKTPNLYVSPAFVPTMTAQGLRLGGLTEVYHNGIESVGWSATKNVEDISLATEVSYRWHNDLVSDPQIVAPGTTADGKNRYLYAVGESLHANLSGIYLYGPSAFWDGGDLLAEVAYNNRLGISRNPGALDPNTTRDAVAFRMIFEPNYFQVLPGLDLVVPIGIGFNPIGRSSTILNFNGGTEGGGDVSIGVKGNYQNVWRIGLSYTSFFGPSGNWLSPLNALQTGQGPVVSNKQSLADRDFVSFTVQRSF